MLEIRLKRELDDRLILCILEMIVNRRFGADRRKQTSLTHRLDRAICGFGVCVAAVTQIRNTKSQYKIYKNNQSTQNTYFHLTFNKNIKCKQNKQIKTQN